ncbi:hypothetical protein, partial [Aeromonas caviae]|uniref:hypothetical protein n=1 Tax=Aeromonas caviae TaxID=648 RepID=UPI00197B3F00
MCKSKIKEVNPKYWISVTSRALFYGAVPIMCWKANLEVGHHREDLHHGYASLPTPVVPLSITYSAS